MSKKKKKARPKVKKAQKSKKPRAKNASDNSLPKRDRKLLEDLFEARDWENLMMTLKLLQDQYPKAPELYAITCMVAQEAKDAELLAHGAYHWVRHAPHHPDALALWGSVALNEMHPGHATRALQTLCQLWPDHEEVPHAIEQLNALSGVWEDLLVELHLHERDDAIQLMCYHEDAQIALQEERFGEALSISKQLLSRMPSFAAARNAASLAQFSMGRVEDALATALEVVEEHDPTNVHALANAIHYLVLLGREEEAEVHGTALRSCDPGATNRDDAFVKKAEGLSYLNDYEAVLECYEDAEDYLDAEAADVEDEKDVRTIADLPHAGLLSHLAATAAANLGDDERARKLWYQATDIEPAMKIAEENLDERQKPNHEQYEPWSFAIYNWLPIEIFKAVFPMYDALAELGDMSPKTLELIRPLAHKIFEKYPVLEIALPQLLGHCGPDGQEYLRLLMMGSGGPTQLAQLEDFATSNIGPDSERGNLLRILLDLGQLKRGSTVKAWVGGQELDQLLLGYSLKPADADLPTDALESLQSVQEALASKDLVTAKQTLEAVRTAHPKAPAIIDLAIPLAQQSGDREAVRQACAEILDHTPDHTWALSTLALLLLEDGKDEEATKTLAPVLSQSHFTAPALLALCEAQIEICLRTKRQDHAIQWLALAQSLLREHPQTTKLQKKFGLWARFKRWMRRKK